MVRRTARPRFVSGSIARAGETLSSLNNPGAAYQDAGRVAAAIPLLERALRGQRSKLGDDHRRSS